MKNLFLLKILCKFIWIAKQNSALHHIHHQVQNFRILIISQIKPQTPPEFRLKNSKQNSALKRVNYHNTNRISDLHNQEEKNPKFRLNYGIITNHFFELIVWEGSATAAAACRFDKDDGLLFGCELEFSTHMDDDDDGDLIILIPPGKSSHALRVKKFSQYKRTWIWTNLENALQ